MKKIIISILCLLFYFSSLSFAEKSIFGQTINFDGVSLSDVFTFFKTTSKLNFSINWKALELSGITKETTIDLQAENISLGRALTLVVEQLNVGKSKEESVYWIVDDSIIKISTGASFNKKLTTKIIDVGDLLVFTPDFKGPRINFEISSNNQSGTSNENTNTNNKTMFDEQNKQTDQKDDSRTEGRKAVKETLTQIIRDAIGEDLWQPNGKGSIKIVGNRIVISQTLLGFKLLEEANVLK